MRLIDADELRKRMYHDAFETDSDLQKWDSGCWIRYKMFEHAIEDAPTIEAEPVKHGRWIEPRRVFDNIYYHCSVCGNHYAIYGDFNYRPNCGAKMEEQG